MINNEFAFWSEGLSTEIRKATDYNWPCQIPFKNMSAQKCSALLNSKYTIKHNLDSFTLFLGAQNEYKFLILSLFPFSPFY